MQSISPGITVNDVKITAEEIDAEVQYHPAESLVEAKHGAMQALVIRELLLQRAAELDLVDKDEDEAIDKLLDKEIIVPEPDTETCKRYYDSNLKLFYTSPLFQVSHILYLAPKEDTEALANAKVKAEKSLELIKLKPELFEHIAKEESGCSSAKDGGRLGQISKDQTMPEFEAALMKMQAGELSNEPVETDVGFHIIKVDERADGQQLPYDSVADNIIEFLKTKSWTTAFNQYIQLLAGNAKISGFRLKQADSPLVQ